MTGWLVHNCKFFLRVLESRSPRPDRVRARSGPAETHFLVRRSPPWLFTWQRAGGWGWALHGSSRKASTLTTSKASPPGATALGVTASPCRLGWGAGHRHSGHDRSVLISTYLWVSPNFPVTDLEFRSIVVSQHMWLLFLSFSIYGGLYYGLAHGMSWRMFYVCLKWTYIQLLGGVFHWCLSDWLVYGISRSSISCQLFCLRRLSFIDTGVLKAAAVTGQVSVFPFISVSFCFMYFGTLLWAVYVFIIVTPPWWIDPFRIMKRYTLSLSQEWGEKEQAWF